ncbi:MAG: hypothetical protein PVS3B3_33510 [Ktedonobacteraceae bacterium]
MIDQRILEVLQRMAATENCYNDNNGRMYCIYCESEGSCAEEWNDVFHDQECPVIVARILLKEIEIAAHVVLIKLAESVVEGGSHHENHSRDNQV